MSSLERCMTKKRPLMDLFHIVLILAILSTVCWPLSILKKGAFAIPFLLSLTWVLFSGCILMPYDGNRRKEFIYPFVKECFPRMEKEQFSNILCCVLVAIPTIIIVRMIINDRVQKN